MTPYFFIFGFGYTAQALARSLAAQGISVVGTTRHLDSSLQASPLIKLIDFHSPDIANELAKATHLLISTPPVPNMGDPVLTQYATYLKKQAAQVQWIGYLSSTGVYGDHQGEWVSEVSLCQPHTPSAISRLKAEQAWQRHAEEAQLPVHIFRLSGIYGPKRNAIARLHQGKPYSLFKPEQVFCRIHVEDIVQTILASIKQPHPQAIYNVSDDEPAPSHVVDQFAALLLQQEPPKLIPIEQAVLSPMEKEFYANNRRVSNAKIKQELKVSLTYPTYREGLTQIWRDEFS